MPSKISLPPLSSSRKSTDDKRIHEAASKCNASYDANDYQYIVGPGSYNLPSSSLGTNALYKSQPAYAISKTKRAFVPVMTEGSGVLYYPDINSVRHNGPHYKIGNSARQPSHFTLNITPGPIYEVKGTLGHQGPKIQSPKFHKSQKEHLEYKLYKLEGMFEEGLRRNRGCPIGKAAKHMILSNSVLPGPGQYEQMGEEKKGISFPKVRG